MPVHRSGCSGGGGGRRLGTAGAAACLDVRRRRIDGLAPAGEANRLGPGVDVGNDLRARQQRLRPATAGGPQPRAGTSCVTELGVGRGVGRGGGARRAWWSVRKRFIHSGVLSISAMASETFKLPSTTLSRGSCSSCAASSCICARRSASCRSDTCRCCSTRCERLVRSSSISFSHSSIRFLSSFICLICLSCSFSCLMLSDPCCISSSLRLRMRAVRSRAFRQGRETNDGHSRHPAQPQAMLAPARRFRRPCGSLMGRGGISRAAVPDRLLELRSGLLLSLRRGSGQRGSAHRIQQHALATASSARARYDRQHAAGASGPGCGQPATLCRWRRWWHPHNAGGGRPADADADGVCQSSLCSAGSLLAPVAGHAPAASASAARQASRPWPLPVL